MSSKRTYYLTKSYIFQVCLGLNKGLNFPKLLSYYKRFLNENLNPKNRIKKRLPWINYGAFDFLNERLNKEFQVFEYGSGSSSLFFSERVNRVISVEHDKNWYKKFMNEVGEELPKNLKILLIEPKTSTGLPPLIFSQTDPKWLGLDFSDYVNAIDNYEDNFFDLIVIDGRARNFCFFRSISKVKPGGLILFDNADRKEYENVLKEFKNWLVLKSYSPTIYDDLFSHTNIYRKPKN